MGPHIMATGSRRKPCSQQRQLEALSTPSCHSDEGRISFAATDETNQTSSRHSSYVSSRPQWRDLSVAIQDAGMAASQQVRLRALLSSGPQRRVVGTSVPVASGQGLSTPVEMTRQRGGRREQAGLLGPCKSESGPRSFAYGVRMTANSGWHLMLSGGDTRFFDVAQDNTWMHASRGSTWLRSGISLDSFST